MKKSLLVFVLIFAAAACAQEAQPAAGAAPQQKKEIKDPAEYNAYMTAFNQTDPAAKAQALEAFLQRYPNTVIKIDAMELLMASYQQAGNAPKVTEWAQKIVQADPNNLRALALLTYMGRAAAGAGGPNAAQALQQAGQYGMQGLQALQTAQKPAEVSEADWEKLKTQTGMIFNGAAGMNALQSKDYANAAKYLSVAVAGNPADLNNVYPLALSYLQMKPQDPVGLWFIARAVSLAPAGAAQQQITAYGRRAYIVYHGGEDGWTDLLAQAAASPNPPAGWKVPPAPTPAEQAAKLVQDKPVSKMSFDEIQLVLTSGNQQAADQVWGGLKDKPIAIEGKLITATPNQLMIAGTYDDIQNNKADIELNMVANIPARLMPKEGTMVQFQGNPSAYEASPFMVHMAEGHLVGKSAVADEKPAPKKPPARRPVRKPQ